MSTPTTPTAPVTQPLTTLEATAIQLVSSVAGLALGFGAISNSTEQVIVSAAGIILGAAVQLANQLHISSLAKAGLLRR